MFKAVFGGVGDLEAFLFVFLTLGDIEVVFILDVFVLLIGEVVLLIGEVVLLGGEIVLLIGEVVLLIGEVVLVLEAVLGDFLPVF